MGDIQRRTYMNDSLVSTSLPESWATVVYFRNGSDVLLAKRSGNSKIGPNTWNGYGGGREGTESPRETTRREVYEESFIEVTEQDLIPIAFVHFENHPADGSVFTLPVFFYECRVWNGHAIQREKMRTPTWFAIDNLPLEEMIPGDRELVPRILKGEKIVGRIMLGPNQQTLLGCVLQTVSDFALQF